MEILNIVGSICSILSLFVAGFIAHKIIRIENSIRISGNNNITAGGSITAGRDIKSKVNH